MSQPIPRTNRQSHQPLWLGNLINGLLDKPVAILYGNVRDIYIEDRQLVHEDISALLRRAARLLASEQVPLREMVVYDVLGVEKRSPLSTTPAGIAPAIPVSPGLLKEDPAGDTAPTKRIDDPKRALAGWFRELADPQQNRLAVLHYLDKLVAYNAAYTDTEKQVLVWLEKIIDKITPNNRLVFVALQDTLVPIELYTRAPKVFVQPIPMPDADDREAYLRYRLGDLEAKAPAKADRFTLLGHLTHGLYLRDLENLCRPLREMQDWSPSQLQRLLNRYRFGEQKDHFGQLDVRRINAAVCWFEETEHVKGQTEAIQKVVDVLTIARAGLAGVSSGTASKPKGVLFFAGPSGVGKTLVAKKLAKFLFGTENAFLRFDMSEFKEEHTVSKLIGSPPGYVGSEQGGMLTNGVRERPFAVVLFDEVEKAHPKIMDLFLQILDEGRLTDSRGQTVFFTEAIVIFTSNIGTRATAQERPRLEALLQDTSRNSSERRALIRHHFQQAVQEYFRREISRPELLNRFGRNIVPFNFIDDAGTQSQIMASSLAQIKAAIEDKYRLAGHQITCDPDLAVQLTRLHGLRLKEYGGRGIADCLEGEVILPLSRALLGAEFRGLTQIRFHLVLDNQGVVCVQEQPAT